MILYLRYLYYLFRIQEHSSIGRIYSIPQFYESLTLHIVVQFKPKLKDRDPKPEFGLILNKKWTYIQGCKSFFYKFNIIY